MRQPFSVPLTLLVIYLFFPQACAAIVNYRHDPRRSSKSPELVRTLLQLQLSTLFNTLQTIILQYMTDPQVALANLGRPACVKIYK